MTSLFRGKFHRLATGALIGLSAVAVAVALAAGIAQSRSRPVIYLKTNVTAIDRSGRATVIAIVHPTPVGGAPNGQVTFIDVTNHKNLGTAPLRSRSGGPCRMTSRSCEAKITVPGRKLVLGANHIIGTFNPEKLYAPSFAGKTWLYRGVHPQCRVRATSQPVFTAGMPTAHQAATRTSHLCRGTVRSHIGINVVVASSSQVAATKNTVIAFGSQRLPCSGGKRGLLAFSIVRQPPGSIAYRVFGREATAAHRAHPNGFICYESTIRFRTASGARARRTVNGSYYGALPHCRDNDGDDIYPVKQNGDDQQARSAPCIEWQQYSVKHGRASWTVWVQPTAGDPRLTHL